MAQLVIAVGTEANDALNIARYVGEKFPLVVTLYSKTTGAAVPVTSATLSLKLGSIEKADIDFDKTYGDPNQAEVVIDDDDTASAGVYVGQLTVKTDDEIMKSPMIRLTIMSDTGVLTVEDLRRELRDTSALNDFHMSEIFTDEELDRARRNAIDEWSSQPGAHRQYTVDTFPEKWVGAWRKGAKAEALIILANNWRLNRIPLSAGGIAVDEKAMVDAIEANADKLKAEWLVFIRSQQYYETIINSFTYLRS